MTIHTTVTFNHLYIKSTRFFVLPTILARRMSFCPPWTQLLVTMGQPNGQLYLSETIDPHRGSCTRFWQNPGSTVRFGGWWWLCKIPPTCEALPSCGARSLPKTGLWSPWAAWLLTLFLPCKALLWVNSVLLTPIDHCAPTIWPGDKVPHFQIFYVYDQHYGGN